MRYSAHLGGLGVVNFVEPVQGLWQTAAMSRQYAVIKTCDAQRHLVAAGTLTRDGVDGVWGPNSRSAMARFVNALPSTIRGLVYTDASGQPAALPFGSREDYRGHSGTEIRVPSAYVLAFPPKANVPCTGGAQTTSTTVSSTEEQAAAEGQSATSTSTEVVEDSGPVVVDTEESARETESSGGGLWLMVAGLALGVIGIAAVRRKGQ